MSHNRDLSAAAAQIGFHNSNIGIATDNPQANLDVKGTLVVGTSGVANGNTTLNGHVIVDRTGVSGTNPWLSVYSSGSSVFYVNGGGSVYANGVNATGGITAGTSGQGTGNSNFYGYLSVDRSGVAGSNTWFQVKNGNTPILYANGNGNFGVGTNSPSVNLHVKGSASNGQIYLGGTGAHSQIYADNDGVLILSADQGNSAANSYLGFNVDNTEALRITSAGNVGIATDNPTFGQSTPVSTYNPKLGVEGSIIIGNLSTTASDRSELQFFRRNGAAGQPIDTHDMGRIAWYGSNNDSDNSSLAWSIGVNPDGGSWTSGSNRKGYMTFNNHDGEKLRITSAGDIGVNTPYPSAKLHVNLTKSSGTTTAERTKQHAAMRLSLDRTTGSMPYQGWGPALDFYSDNYDGSTQRPNARIAGVISNYSLGDEGGELRFYTTPTDTATSESDFAQRMTITSAGYVLKPNTPAFFVYKNQSAWTLAANDVFVFNTAEFNVGGHYSTSNGRFTAPITGRYVFHFFSIYTGNAAGDSIEMYKNSTRMYGGDVHFTNDVGSNWDTVHYSRVIQLSSGDYVHMQTRTGHTFHGNHWGGWSGYLLG